MGARLAAEPSLRGDPRRIERAATLRAARRPALCERRHSHRNGVQQDPEGHRRQKQDDGRVRCALCAGLGLPRHADRGADREDARQASVDCRDAATLSRLRDRADRAPARAIPKARRAGRLGPPVHDDGVQERGRRDPHARQGSGKRVSLPRLEAGQLVLRLRQRARGSRSRVRGSRRFRDRRGISADRSRRARETGARIQSPRCSRRPDLRGDLDDDAVDDSGQPGVERPSGNPVRARAHAAWPPAVGGRIASGVPQAPMAPRWKGSHFSIRSTIVPRPFIWANS